MIHSQNQYICYCFIVWSLFFSHYEELSVIWIWIHLFTDGLFSFCLTNSYILCNKYCFKYISNISLFNPLNSILAHIFILQLRKLRYRVLSYGRALSWERLLRVGQVDNLIIVLRSKRNICRSLGKMESVWEGAGT